MMQAYIFMKVTYSRIRHCLSTLPYFWKARRHKVRVDQPLFRSKLRSNQLSCSLKCALMTAWCFFPLSDFFRANKQCDWLGCRQCLSPANQVAFFAVSTNAPSGKQRISLLTSDIQSGCVTTLRISSSESRL